MSSCGKSIWISRTKQEHTCLLPHHTEIAGNLCSLEGLGARPSCYGAPPPIPDPMLSVIIPTKNSERALVPTLAVLVPGALTGTVRQVIIADRSEEHTS